MYERGYKKLYKLSRTLSLWYISLYNIYVFTANFKYSNKLQKLAGNSTKLLIVKLQVTKPVLLYNNPDKMKV